MSGKNNYLLPFPKRLRGLIDETQTSQQEIADYVGVSRQAVAQWKDGKSIPDMYNFKKVAEFFKVPLEYLYGDTDSRVQENMRLSEELGLSDKAVAKLKRWANERLADEARAALIEILSDIIANDDFDVFLKRAQQYIIENLDYRLYEEERTAKGFAYTAQDAAFTVGDADKHARIVGMRAIKAEDLSMFYRYQAVETLGVILASLPDEYYVAYHQKREEAEYDKQRAKK